jgi:hypothetical protein
MAKLWGTSSAAGQEQKPNWLTDEEKENCFATSAGWVLRHPDGTEELLVAVAGLSLEAKLSAASITAIRFANGIYTEGTTKVIRVQYNEKVTVTGTPTLTVTGSVAGAITASYVSTNTAGDTILFEFVVPAAGDTLTIGAQSINITGDTITETGVTPTINGEVVISADVATAAGSKLTVAA